MKRKLLLVLIGVLAMFAFVGCGSKSGEYITVINYGEYFDMDLIDQFTEETGIEVKYEEAPTPEDMYAKYSAGAIKYDVICTSEYMAQRLIEEGALQKIDYSAMENIGNIGDKYWDLNKAVDPTNEYAMPFFWGTVGILYDTTRVNGPVDSWEVLFNGEYKDDIIMQNSVRDAFTVALKYLGYSLNTTNPDELNEAKELLIKQKPDVQAYLVDEARDETVAGNAVMAVIYSGEARIGRQSNPNLDYAIPKEGSNVWIDSWLMTKDCQNVDAALKFFDFICREDVAYQNFQYVGYSNVNEAVNAMLTDEERADKVVIPDDKDIANCEVFKNLDPESTELYNSLWKEIRAQ